MAVGLILVKRFTYRDQTDEYWSNKYHLTGADPANSTEWRALVDAFIAEEKKLYSTLTSVTGAYGYTSDADGAVSVYQLDLEAAPNSPVNGTLTPGTQNACPGDAAALVRWGLDRVNSRGKRVYLRKYFHDVYTAGSTGTTKDDLWGTQKTAMNAFAALLDPNQAGDIAGRYIRDTGGADILGHSVGDYVTTRTLKRRGKRPPT